MPYRIDISNAPDTAFDKLVSLGALDIEFANDGVAAIIPDGVTADVVAATLGVPRVTVSTAIGRDDGSIWLLKPRAVRLGRLVIAAPHVEAPDGALRLTDTAAFGTGHHPTTQLCAEALEDTLTVAIPDSVLDVGTGSGVLALAALMMGVPRAVGLDIDADALEIAATNARLNGLADRLELVHGEADAVDGVWSLVIANVLAAPLIEMAPILIRRVGRGGQLILSGIPVSLESEVKGTYVRLGMRTLRSTTRGGWSALITQASW